MILLKPKPAGWSVATRLAFCQRWLRRREVLSTLLCKKIWGQARAARLFWTGGRSRQELLPPERPLLAFIVPAKLRTDMP